MSFTYLVPIVEPSLPPSPSLRLPSPSLPLPPSQIAFQVVLLTDGLTSFAIFSYVDLDPILAVINRQVGFDAGDGNRSATLLSVANPTNNNSISPTSIFRIDGNL